MYVVIITNSRSITGRDQYGAWILSLVSVIAKIGKVDQFRTKVREKMWFDPDHLLCNGPLMCTQLCTLWLYNLVSSLNSLSSSLMIGACTISDKWLTGWILGFCLVLLHAEWWLAQGRGCSGFANEACPDPSHLSQMECGGSFREACRQGGGRVISGSWIAVSCCQYVLHNFYRFITCGQMWYLSRGRFARSRD